MSARRTLKICVWILASILLICSIVGVCESAVELTGKRAELGVAGRDVYIVGVWGGQFEVTETISPTD